MFRFLVFLLPALFILTAMTPGLYITFPEPDGTVSGIVEVKGSIPESSFESAQLEYSYANSASGTWFLIARLDRVIQDEVLANWDTTTISDGTYTLRLKVFYRNGKSDVVKVENIKVANYTRPGQTPAVSMPIVTVAPLIPENTNAPEVNPTLLPDNPASISGNQFVNSLYAGSLVAISGLVILGIYSGLRKFRRRR